MNTPEDPIEKLLLEQETYVDDKGFTARVTAKLPRRNLWPRRVILLGAAAAGTVMAAYWVPWHDLPSFDLSALSTSGPDLLMAWLPLLAVGSALLHAVIRGLQED